MSTLSMNPKDWTEDDLKDLIRDGVEENARLEYKREVDLSPKGKKEACKDVSAFANGQGGTIIYGMEEEELKDAGSIPKAIKPIADSSVKESLENVLLSGASPPLHFWIWPIPVTGGHCLAIQIPQSPSTHMVTIGGESRYYIRRNFQSSPMTEDEVSNHYARRMVAQEEADRRYESERTDISRYKENAATQLCTLPLIKQPRVIDFRKFPPESFREGMEGFLRKGFYTYYKLSANEYMFPRDEDIWSRITSSGTCEYVRIFGSKSEGIKNFPSKVLVEDLHDFLLHYGRVYASVGYYGPVRVYYRLENTKDGVLGVGRFIERSTATRRYFVHEANTFVESLFSDPRPIVHEIMDYVWIFFGFQGGCEYFNEGSTFSESWKQL